MPRILYMPCILIMFLICGCAMFTAWKAIPPPGGCDQCHTVPINSKWTMAYKAPILSDERNRDYFQRPEYTMPPSARPSSQLETRKVEDQKCFACHKAPDAAHKERMGRYHHK